MPHQGQVAGGVDGKGADLLEEAYRLHQGALRQVDDRQGAAGRGEESGMGGRIDRYDLRRAFRRHGAERLQCIPVEEQQFRPPLEGEQKQPEALVLIQAGDLPLQGNRLARLPGRRVHKQQTIAFVAPCHHGTGLLPRKDLDGLPGNLMERRQNSTCQVDCLQPAVQA